MLRQTYLTPIEHTRPRLIEKQPKRLFTFGCSFTRYMWPCWPEIISSELDIPFYDYGKAGAGNQYIFSSMMFADSCHAFTEDDLVMVCWTNFCREDRYFNQAWKCYGNIYHLSDYYPEDYVRKYVDPVWYSIRDLAIVKAALHFLEARGCQFHQMKMVDFSITNQKDTKTAPEQKVAELLDLYKPCTDKILPSYYRVLWDNNMSTKMKKNSKTIYHGFYDNHPLPDEHLEYLSTVFDHEFSKGTREKVAKLTSEIVEELRDFGRKNGNSVQPHQAKINLLHALAPDLRKDVSFP